MRAAASFGWLAESLPQALSGGAAPAPRGFGGSGMKPLVRAM